MLLDQLHGSEPGRVVVRTREPALGRLLQAILTEWHYLTEPGPPERTVALVEAGLPAPAGVGHTLWLSRAAAGEQPGLAVPLSLSALYQFLQERFHSPPRRYLRLALNLPVKLDRATVCLDGCLLSLSERGGRIGCHAVLPVGEAWQLNVMLAGCLLRITADIIYLIPPGDLPGKELRQYGLLFKALRPELGRAVRRQVERTLLERACARTGMTSDDPVVDWFDTMANPWAGLTE